MLRKLYQRWCLRRIRLLYDDVTYRREAVASLYHMGRGNHFRKIPYPIRVTYHVHTKTSHLGGLLSLIKTVQDYIHLKKDYIEDLPVIIEPRKWISMDRYLVDSHALPYDEVTGARYLLDAVVDLLGLMAGLKETNLPRYSYINQSIQFLYTEIISVLDAFIAMQLSIPTHTDLKQQSGMR